MCLVERDAELAALGGLLGACRGGAVAVISGPAGSGKTSLLRAFARQAAGAGGRYLGAAACPAERLLALGVAGQLSGSAAAALAGKAGWPPEGDALLPPADRAWPQPRPATTRLFGQLRHQLLQLADRGPLVIGIDDVHDCDLPSAQFLLYLVRRVHAARLVVVLTECAQLPAAGPSLRAEVTRQPGCRRIRLAPLSRTAVAAVLAGRPGAPRPGPPAGPLARQCHAVTGGSPLLVRALAQDYRAVSEHGQDEPAGLVFGPAFSRAVTGLLGRYGPAVLAAAQAAAVLDQPGTGQQQRGADETAALLGELLGHGAESAAQLLGVLDAAGLLTAGRFRHEASRGAVLAAMSGADRAALERRGGAPARTRRRRGHPGSASAGRRPHRDPRPGTAAAGGRGAGAGRRRRAPGRLLSAPGAARKR